MDEQKFQNYLNYLQEMLGKDVSKLPQVTIVENYLLPKFVGILGTKQRQRGYVSDEFMDFMAKWGQYCFELDQKTAYTLMLIAMQRILQGGVFYEKRSVMRNLYDMPEQYGNYAAWADKDMPMNRVCWQFLEANLEFCLNKEGMLNELSSVILRCLLRNLNAIGQVSTIALGYVWDEKEIGISVRSAYLWALDVARKHYGLEWCCRVQAPVWREKMFFFRKYRDQIGWWKVMKYFSFDKEKYYTGWVHTFLKGLFLYDLLTMWRIKKEIFAA